MLRTYHMLRVTTAPCLLLTTARALVPRFCRCRAKLRVLPTVGDILLEGELMQTFLAEFLSSAKLMILVLSILKADRVRRGARALRRERAVRKIVQWMRRLVAHRRVGKLQRNHAWWSLLSNALKQPPMSPEPPPSSAFVASPMIGQKRHLATISGSPSREADDCPGSSDAQHSAPDFMPQDGYVDEAHLSPPRHPVSASLPSTDDRGRVSSRANRALQLVDDLASALGTQSRELSPRKAIGTLRRNLFSAPANMDALRHSPGRVPSSGSGEWLRASGASNSSHGSGEWQRQPSGEWRRVPSGLLSSAGVGGASGEWASDAEEATRRYDRGYH